MNKETRDLAVYVLVRTDIPSMNPGKAMAQVHHAGVQMLNQSGHNTLVNQYIADGAAAGAVGFNTTIILAANRSQIDEALSAAADLYHRNATTILYSEVVDPSYPFLVSREVWEWANSLNSVPGNLRGDDMVVVTRKEVTCAWFLGDRNNPEFKNLFEGLKLHE